MGWDNSSGKVISAASEGGSPLAGPLPTCHMGGREQQPPIWFAASPFLKLSWVEGWQEASGSRSFGEHPQGPTTPWAKFSPEAQHVSELQFPAFLGKAREIPEINHKGGLGVSSPPATFQKRANGGLGSVGGACLPFSSPEKHFSGLQRGFLCCRCVLHATTLTPMPIWKRPFGNCWRKADLGQKQPR